MVVQPQVTVVAPAVEAPAPDGAQYATWIPSHGKCASGREFHVRCVRGAAGQACFYETDDGESFDCADAECARTPDAINGWCQSTGVAR